MDIVSIIKELRRELERIDGLIIALETLQAGRRRGRPPKALQALRDGVEANASPAARRAAKAVRKASGKAEARRGSAAKEREP